MRVLCRNPVGQVGLLGPGFVASDDVVAKREKRLLDAWTVGCQARVAVTMWQLRKSWNWSKNSIYQSLGFEDLEISVCSYIYA